MKAICPSRVKDVTLSIFFSITSRAHRLIKDYNFLIGWNFETGCKYFKLLLLALFSSQEIGY